MGKILAIQHNFSEEKMNISIETFDQDNIRLDELYFFKIPKRVGRYSLSYTSSQPPDDSLVGVEYFHGYDDVIYDIYEVATTDSTSYLEITEYNDRKDEFRGKFHLTLYRTLKGSINVPDTLIFTEGTFHTRIDN